MVEADAAQHHALRTRHSGAKERFSHPLPTESQNYAQILLCLICLCPPGMVVEKSRFTFLYIGSATLLFQTCFAVRPVNRR